jgi:hypothetical protein
LGEELIEALRRGSTPTKASGMPTHLLRLVLGSRQPLLEVDLPRFAHAHLKPATRKRRERAHKPAQIRVDRRRDQRRREVGLEHLEAVEERRSWGEW